MKKTTGLITILAGAAVVIIVGYLMIGNPTVFINNQKLKNAVKSVRTETVSLNEVVPFAWDTVYTFTPYTDKKSIEEIIGFKSADIKVNNVNEDMIHLIFVKGQKIAASVLGYRENLGYSIDFISKVTFTENARFRVTRTGEAITLTRIE